MYARISHNRKNIDEMIEDEMIEDEMIEDEMIDNTNKSFRKGRNS